MEDVIIQKASKKYGFSSQILRKWEKEGKITSHRTPNNTRMYRICDLENQLGLKELSSTYENINKSNFCYSRNFHINHSSELKKIQSLYPDHICIDDVNMNEFSGVLNIFTEALKGKVGETVFIINHPKEYGDECVKQFTELITNLFSKMDVKIKILNYKFRTEEYEPLSASSLS